MLQSCYKIFNFLFRNRASIFRVYLCIFVRNPTRPFDANARKQKNINTSIRKFRVLVVRAQQMPRRFRILQPIHAPPYFEFFGTRFHSKRAYPRVFSLILRANGCIESICNDAINFCSMGWFKFSRLNNLKLNTGNCAQLSRKLRKMFVNRNKLLYFLECN